MSKQALSKTLACLAVALSFGIAGCSDLMVPPRIGPPVPRLADSGAEASYQKVLARWTRRAEIYQGFDSQVFFVATMQSREFREARVSRLAAFRSMSNEEVTALLEKERQDESKFVELILGVQPNERRFDDFAKPDSSWRISLSENFKDSDNSEGSKGSNEVLPIAIERLQRPTPFMRALYPFLDDFWTVYRVKFPRAEQQTDPANGQAKSSFIVKIASSLGKAELRY